MDERRSTIGRGWCCSRGEDRDVEVGGRLGALGEVGVNFWTVDLIHLNALLEARLNLFSSRSVGLGGWTCVWVLCGWRGTGASGGTSVVAKVGVVMC